MNRTYGPGLACALLGALMAFVPARAGELDEFKECWRAGFTEQSSGAVREKTTAGGIYKDFISTYDGDFRWLGDPLKAPVNVVYVYCFRPLEPQGGAVLLEGRKVELARVGASVRSAMGREVMSGRDDDIVSNLYGRFGSDAAPTMLQVKLDRQDSTTTVTTLSRKGRQTHLVYMKGTAERIHPR